MFKDTPNPPDSDSASRDTSPGAETLNQSADNVAPIYKRKPSNIVLIAPDIDNRTLLEYACESLASANVMASDFVRFLEGSQCNTLLGIQQSIMLGELAVNRVLDNFDSP
ncbi:DUF6124 family protein [Pseudomonas sp. dw_612]|uniref:DUF6124 family protein n=1 Tax=Pseudomonas sp. dw_612 TaxID=2720080 RepID=UPI001BD3AF6A|nr:DUF6124 family protein [Pseudomonas sp. dw_612]